MAQKEPQDPIAKEHHVMLLNLLGAEETRKVSWVFILLHNYS